MSGEVNKSVQGHTQENKAVSKSTTFENCTFQKFTLNVFRSPNNDDGEEVEFSSPISGDVNHNNVLQLPNDADTIVEVIMKLRDQGIEPKITVPENVNLETKSIE